VRRRPGRRELVFLYDTGERTGQYIAVVFAISDSHTNNYAGSGRDSGAHGYAALGYSHSHGNTDDCACAHVYAESNKHACAYTHRGRQP